MCDYFLAFKIMLYSNLCLYLQKYMMFYLKI